jgi:putative ABC transport system substrate-binding protein
MRRRNFLALLSGAATWPLAARAQQQDRVRRVAILSLVQEGEQRAQSRVLAFTEALERLGWVEGRNVHFDYRWGVMDDRQAEAAAAELLKMGAPDVILSNGSVPRQAARMVPIVFTQISEPITRGYVQSLARPGGNITGFSQLEPTVGAKWLQILKEVAPRVTHVAVMYRLESSPISPLFFESIEAVAAKLAVEAVSAAVHEPGEIESVMTMLGNRPGGGLILPPDTFTAEHLPRIMELAVRYRLPTVHPHSLQVAAGGLVSYGIDVLDQHRRAAEYVDRILRGEKPAQLPVQQPTKFELVINLNTAKAIGLEVPPLLLARADEVIE